ncbi:MAG: rRNA-processing protein bfr2 [Peltula sp. TS41687]|nr:MAG: rRNA-processing protein bfr2 [Peltula sp. TS41687]
MKRPKTLAEQIADLDDPAPRDFDPEDDVPDQVSSDDESQTDESQEDVNGLDHYELVGRSKLRGHEELTLGPEYHGSRTSRRALLEEGDGDDDYDGLSTASESRESSDLSERDEGNREADIEDQSVDEEVSEDRTDGDMDHLMTNGDSDVNLSNGRVKLRKTAKADLANEDDDRESKVNSVSEFRGFSDTADENGVDGSSVSDARKSPTGEDEEDDDNVDEDSDEEEVSEVEQRDQRSKQRAELRRMMSEEQKAVVTRIAEATRADAEKGRAVKHQRKAYDTVLNARIRLQKGLIAMNTLSATTISASVGSQHEDEIYRTTEAAALQLWNQLSQLRCDFQTATFPTKSPSSKRKLEDVDSSTPLLKIWSEMEEQESIASSYRQASLEKWSAKVRGVTNLSIGSRLNNTASQVTITDVLNEHLSNTERLVKRTKVPRSCAPVQAQRGMHEASEIYDDADFYQLQLKELVDQRLADSGTSSMMPALNQMAAMREAKTKKKVDTKASKGRKLRYTVHEKLQNFMVAEDRGSWDVRQIDELFGSLLGAKVRLEDDEEEEDDDDLEERLEGGLKLFRS